MKLDGTGRRRMVRRAVRRLRLATYWQARGDLDAAAGYAHQALNLVRAHPAPPLEPAVEVARVTARIERDREEPTASLGALNWAVELLLEAPGGADRDRLLGRTLVDLADCHRRAGRYPQAAEVLEQARPLVRDTEPADSMQPAELFATLGIVAKETGDFDQAAHWYAEAGRVVERNGKTASCAAASLQHNLAGLAHIQRRYAQAETHARLAVALRRQAPGAARVDVAADTAVLAAALAGQQRYDEARELFVEAMTTCERARPSRRYEIAVHLHNLAAIDQATGRHEEAERGYRRALDIKEGLLGPDHPEIGLLANNLGTLLSEQRRDAEATACYRRALAIAERGLPPGHPTTIAIRRNLETPGGRQE